MAVSFVIVGIGGYGGNYIEWVRKLQTGRDIKLAGVVDVQYEKCIHYAYLREEKIPCFRSLAEFYESSHADVAVIATPIHLHREQTIMAMQNGSHVLCEKPAAGTVAEAEAMAEAARQYGRCLAVGFQWSYQPANLAFKKEVQAGVWGNPVLFKTLVLWPRTTAYFSERGWAGKRCSVDGKPIFDSIAANATAHYLHNMLFVLGSEPAKAASAQLDAAVLYRCNAIETFDAIQARITANEKTPLLFYAAHCVADTVNPRFLFQFENGVVEYGYTTAPVLRGTFNSGIMRTYGSLNNAHAGLEAMITALETNDFSAVTCDIHTASVHVGLMAQINAELDKTQVMPEHRLYRYTKDGRAYVAAAGMLEKLSANYEKAVIVP